MREEISEFQFFRISILVSGEVLVSDQKNLDFTPRSCDILRTSGVFYKNSCHTFDTFSMSDFFLRHTLSFHTRNTNYIPLHRHRFHTSLLKSDVRTVPILTREQLK